MRTQGKRGWDGVPVCGRALAWSRSRRQGSCGDTGRTSRRRRARRMRRGRLSALPSGSSVPPAWRSVLQDAVESSRKADDVAIASKKGHAPPSSGDSRRRDVMTVVRTLAPSVILLLGCAGPSSPPQPQQVSQPGTAVESRVFSTDSCEIDDDCAPVATCHADKCVRREHAGTLPSGLMCTMECRGGTVDCGYNHCGCAPSPSGPKLCALLAGAAKR